ncbi:hypothetical protein CKO24_06050 [Rhodothalassium salexigens DSM 2132]|nr:hypothetical protein [Rhodothalassium salexigens DSM 2132]
MKETPPMTERPWLTAYAQDVDWHQRFEAKPLYALLDATAAARPDRPHLYFKGRRYRYRDTKALSDRFAKGLQELGVGRGTKVGLFLPNCPQFVVAYYGALKAGATVVNYSPLYSVPELLHQVEDSETDLIVTLDVTQLFPTIHHVFTESRLQRLIVSSLRDVLPPLKGLGYSLTQGSQIAALPNDDSWLGWRRLLDNDGAYADPGLDPHEDVAVLQYTGGTTGTPKGAMLTHANLSINAQQTLAWDPTIRPGEEVMLGALPLFHVFAMTLVMNATTFGGGEIVLMPKFELDEALDLVTRRRVTQMPGVPTMFNAILNHAKLDKYDLSSLKACFSGGAPLPREVKRRFEERVPGSVVNEGYGLTESSPTASANPIIGENRSGSIGLPMPGTDIVITDPDDPRVERSVGETGEICIRGPQVMKGYFKQPEASDKVLVDGLLRTGDIGYMDAQGYTYLIDRNKDLILVGGFNVYPRTVEEAVYSHPAVQECTVIGIPHDHLGEAPKAFVVLKEDHSLEDERLLSYLRERLGKHELPREIEFRDSLPKTMVGKLSKKELVEEERAKYEARVTASAKREGQRA